VRGLRFGPEEYSLNFLRERGYIRRRCIRCGEHFWSLDPDRELCGESPCEPYRFVGRSLTRRRMSLHEVRESFLRFFERRGHTIIAPYPVVARWRSDIFLTDASIVDFQPYVTSGIAPPPANPLVISQPCIRLVDIDKVGLTFGRHLTIFEMGGAHAFNYPDKEVYWKEETAQYYHEFAQEIFGIPEEEIIYKEGVWAGGGNAGPCFEAISYGLEVATLVFMQYKTVDDDLIKLPIRTVDTGYGMERFTWLTQGTPSCFDAIYGELYPRLREIVGFPEVDRELLIKYSPYTALVVPKAGMTVAEARRRISDASGIPLETITSVIAPLEKIYASLDFTKSITFIISEGVVPSNVRVGYLARLLVRKAYRLLKELGYEDKIIDLINLQIDYWGRDFPHLREMRNETIDIVEHEIRKFEDTIAKGIDYIEKELVEVRKRGAAEAPLEFIIRAYDERGVTPDIVRLVAEKLGMGIRVPENFYELVASRHLREEPAGEADERTMLLEEGFKDLPPTEKLYYKDPSMLEFEARVLRARENHVALDKTCFYPEGGGAVPDQGILRHSRGECRVVDAQILEGGVIVHRVDGPPPTEGELVRGVVDRERRFSIMRHHTATHIILGAARRVLGKHAWQAGARKEPGFARLDISHHRRLNVEEVARIEEEANKVVAARIPVRVMEMDRNEAERRYGFQLYQGGEVPSAAIRVVEIPRWDAEACGGLHAENTEGVGLIKIIRTERIQDGVERLVFAAGPAALQYIQQNWLTTLRLAEKLGAPVEAVEKALDETLSELKRLRSSVRRLLSAAAELRYRELREMPIALSGINVYVTRELEDDKDYVLKISDKLLAVDEPTCFIAAYGGEKPYLLVTANEAAVKSGVYAGRLASIIAGELGGRGGGRDRLGQGGLGEDVSEKRLEEVSTRALRQLLK
jgi:alanyl-tRNA synthetase